MRYDWAGDIAPFLDTMQPVEGGYSTARRGVVTLADGQKVFIKIAEGDMTKKWLSKEIDVYKKLNAAEFAFIPQLLGHDDNHSAMVIEYLDGASFENVWSVEKLEAVMNAQEELKQYKHIFSGDPDSTLASVIGLDEKWSRIIQPVAIESLNNKFSRLGVDVQLSQGQVEAYEQELVGWKISEDTLVHQDIRADNFGYDPQTKQGKLIDWNWLCVGDESLDTTPLFVNMYVSGFDPYILHPEKYDSQMLVYLISFWLERILSGGETMDNEEFKRRQAQAKSVKAAIELLDRF